MLIPSEVTVALPARSLLLSGLLTLVACRPSPHLPAAQPDVARHAPPNDVAWLEAVPPLRRDSFSCPTQTLSLSTSAFAGMAPVDGTCARLVTGCGFLAPGKRRDEARCDPMFDVHFAGPVVVGHAWVLRRSNAGWFGLHAIKGMAGPLAAPQRKGWLGIDELDRLTAVDERGQVYFADSVTEAMRGWALRGRAPKGIGTWDVSSKVLVGAAKDAVIVSSDLGHTFSEPKVLRQGAHIDVIAARRDGVIAVMGERDDKHTTWLSRDRGQTFQRSALQPETLMREGGWILGYAPGCGEVVLSQDGVSWAPTTRRENFDYHAAFAHSQSGKAEPLKPRGNRLIPAIPRVPMSQFAVKECTPPQFRSHRARPPKIKMGVLSWPDCRRNTDCLGLKLDLSDEQHFTRSAWSFFHDGLCSAQRYGRSCFEPEAEFDRKPAILQVDRQARSARATPLPAGCEPQRLFHARGLALLLCDGPAVDRVKVYVAKRAAPWAYEGTVTAYSKLVRFEVARDGTAALMGRARQSADAVAWLRTRAQPGQGKWRAWSSSKHTVAFRGLGDDRVAAAALDYETGELSVVRSPKWGEARSETLLRHRLDDDVSIIGLCRNGDRFDLITTARRALGETVQVRAIRNGRLGTARTEPLVLPLCQVTVAAKRPGG